MEGNEIPDTVPTFDEPPRTDYGAFCLHSAYVVNDQQRRVTCQHCKAQLDPFEIIHQWANRSRVREDLDSMIRKAREQLATLHAEEKRTKARTRNARKKDADAAVAKALAKAKTDHERTVFTLLGARGMITSALEQLGHQDAPWERPDV